MNTSLFQIQACHILQLRKIKTSDSLTGNVIFVIKFVIGLEFLQRKSDTRNLTLNTKQKC